MTERNFLKEQNRFLFFVIPQREVLRYARCILLLHESHRRPFSSARAPGAACTLYRQLQNRVRVGLRQRSTVYTCRQVNTSTDKIINRTRTYDLNLYIGCETHPLWTYSLKAINNSL